MTRNQTLCPTKIVCTLGPATNSKERVRELVEAGMDVARLNFSHGTHDDHRCSIEWVREVARDAGIYVAILQDLCGPKIRTGPMTSGSVPLTAGAVFTLTSRETPGSPDEVSLNYAGLVSELEPGDVVLLADGALELRVERTTETDAVCRVIAGGELGSHKGISVPGRVLALPSMTAKDRADLEFGLRHEVDWVALSFVRAASDVAEARRAMGSPSRAAPIMAKVEKAVALGELDAILMEADGVMVARGDLGVEIPMEEVPWVQKDIIRKANFAGMPVITATQMLESMISSPRPTRAEMTDIANAILDGTDAVMLSAETAVGAYPVQAVRTMNEIARAASAHALAESRARAAPLSASSDISDAISRAACQMAAAVQARFIICCTRSGQTARSVAKCRPPMPIVAASHHERVLRGLQLCWGTVPVRIDAPSDTDDMVAKAKRAVLSSGMGRYGDRVAIVAGTPLSVEGTTNTVKLDVL
ncbi:pyruvate kinase [Candidatus Poribacteria bacterium]|nr:pyruvate kinase [Candidatus Poribacteria bacterium]